MTKIHEEMRVVNEGGQKVLQATLSQKMYVDTQEDGGR
jgi:hypothetical protein